MADLSLTNKAVDDLSKIWNYTCQVWSELQADKYYYMLLDACQDLADNRLSGKPYPELSAEILGCKAGQHIIFYRKGKKNSIEIARILHGRMDLKNRIKE
jgi:toxin ParE1/3/4